MPLDPQVRQWLKSISAAAPPPVEALSPAEARRQMEESIAALGEPQPIHAIERRVAAGRGGEIPVRVYRPSAEPLPVIVYFHGGGWVVGNLDTHDGFCRALAHAATAMVISVQYRLAPEHRFPAAAEDAYDATVWARDNLSSLGAHCGGVIVAGDSAGGNLAAAATLMARDRGGPPLAGQVLIYPITDHDFETPSYREFADDHFLTRGAMRWFWDQYCPDQAQRDDPYISPLRADELRGLPPALVITAQFDPLRDEGEAYAARLREAHVGVSLTRYDGMLHGFARRLNTFDKAPLAVAEISAAVKAMFARFQ